MIYFVFPNISSRKAEVRCEWLKNSFKTQTEAFYKTEKSILSLIYGLTVNKLSSFCWSNTRLRSFVGDIALLDSADDGLEYLSVWDSNWNRLAELKFLFQVMALLLSGNFNTSSRLLLSTNECLLLFLSMKNKLNAK